MNCKTVVITGTSSGIGYALATYFTKEGHTVYGVSRKKPLKPYKWIQLMADITKAEDVKEVFSNIQEQTNIIDVLINCAGMGYAGALEETSLKDISYLFSVNVFAPVVLINQALPFLRNSEDARIINIGSVASEITIPFQTLYSMSKSAMIRMSEGLRMELKPEHIQVTTVLPGDTKTDFTANRQLLTKETSKYYQRANKSVQRMAKDEKNGMSVDAVVRVVSKQVTKKRMKVFVTVGLKYKLFVWLSHILPSKLREMLIYKMYAS